MPTTMTVSVAKLLCTSALSTMSWKKIGVTSANAWTNNDATTTSASGLR